MKKLISCFFILLALFFANSSKSVKAENFLGSWDWLPKGENYLDPNNVTWESDYPYISAQIIHPFKVKSDRIYTLFSGHKQSVFFDLYNFSFYDVNLQLIEESVVYEEFYDGDVNIYAINFVTPVNAVYISFDVVFYETENDHFDYTQFDYHFVFCEGYTYPNLSFSIVPYLGPNCDFSPVISGNNGYFIANVDNPVTVENIKSYLMASDDVDGDITNNIMIEEDNYTANNYLLGDYEVIFKVSDSANNTAYFTIIVSVIDTTDPVISGKSFYSIKETEQKNHQYFIDGLNVTDNYDILDKSNIQVLVDNYTANYNIQGVYDIIFGISDLSDNSSTFTVTINVIDGISPTIVGPTHITKPNNVEMTMYAILQNFTASDQNDGNVTNRIMVSYDNYSKNATKIGQWQIVLECKDTQDNVAYHTVTIEVIDKTIPVFLVDKRVITIDISENRLNVRDMINLLVKTKAINTDAEVVVYLDEYSENKNTPGNYKIILGVDDEKMELEVKVVEGLYEQLKEKGKLNFFQIMMQFIIHMWKKILFSSFGFFTKFLIK